MPSPVSTRTLLGVALISGSLLMTELSLTRIFSVTIYYHFAFMAISIALFGLSASGVYVFLMRERWRDVPSDRLLVRHSIAFSVVTLVALAVLVRMHVGLSYTPANIALMSLVYLLSALPFFAGGATITIAISRLSASVNAVYAADLLGAGLGCLVLMPALNILGAPGAIALSAVVGGTIDGISGVSGRVTEGALSDSGRSAPAPNTARPPPTQADCLTTVGGRADPAVLQRRRRHERHGRCSKRPPAGAGGGF